MLNATSVFLSAVIVLSLGNWAKAEGLAERVTSVVTTNDLLTLEKSETDEQKKDFQPRLRSLLLGTNLPKNNASVELLDVRKTSLIAKVWAKLFLENQDVTTSTYFLKFPDGQRHLARLVVTKSSEDKVSFELLGKPVTDELIADSKFDFEDKTFSEYFFLFVVILVSAFILHTFILCIRAKFERRWFWLGFILFGFFQYDMNWATGRFGFRPLSLVLFGSQFHHGLDFSPWILSTSVPVGAILYYFRVRVKL